MAIPTYEDFMLPLLKSIEDGQVHRLRDLYLPLAKSFGLTDDQIAEKLPSGQQCIVPNRIGWARTYLKKAGLVSSPKRGWVTITTLGQDVLRENPTEVNYKFLERFESFREFRVAHRKNADSETGDERVISGGTPEEVIEAAHEQLREQLSSDLLEKVKECSPYFFETVVLRLLQAMGYGGVSGSGMVTPASRGTAVSTELFTKINSVLILSASKRSGGKIRWVAKLCNSLLEAWIYTEAKKA